MDTPTAVLSAYDALHALVGRAAQQHPHLGLSFGYIGNVWNDPRYQPQDDRSWRVFNKVATGRIPVGSMLLYDWTWGGGDFATEHLPAMLAWVEGEQFPRYLARLQRQYDQNAAAGRHDLNVATYQTTTPR
jgi:hypothetical protein